jgi:ribonuclease HII
VAWIIGIDEAGYGPNLGPFVMTLAACRVPDDQAGRCLWQLLDGGVRKSADPADERLLIDDSKVVHSQTRGLAGLERGVLAVLGRGGPASPLCLADLLTQLCPASLDGLKAEPWYTGASRVPCQAGPDELEPAALHFEHVCGDCGVGPWHVRSVVVTTPSFNSLVDQGGSKGRVLAEALAQLLRQQLQHTPGGDALAFYIDKHGGRNTYSAQIQHALPNGGMVLAHQESLERSHYQVLGLGREVRLTFQPRADGEHFCVALASMASKYLRELLMQEFNRFWQTHVPGLSPTAGYPNDAVRFLEAIRPAVTRLGLTEAAVWRKK